MRAIEYKDNKLNVVSDYPEPLLKDNEALIKVNMAGICNTDIEITKGYMGFSGILGHEFVGVVKKINGNDQSLLNKRVVGEINCACNSCEYCADNLQTHCPNRTVLGIFNKDGCFAEYITMPLENLHEIPDSVSDEEAVFVEPLAAAFEILDQVYIKPTDKIAVLGDGKLGLLIALALKLSPASIILIGKHSDKLEIAQKQGVNVSLLNDIEIKPQFDIVVEATGNINGFETALNLLKPRGTMVLKSTIATGKEINLAPIVINEINVVGSRCGPFKPAIKALINKLIDVKPLISGIYKFNEAQTTFKKSTEKDILKILLDLR